jgi:hypothetical protein
MSEIQKVLFVQKLDDDEFETESLWCVKSGSNFIVDNIPFVAKRISFGDIIKAEYDEDDKAFYFDDFVEVSGNSTLRLYFNDESMIEEIRSQLNLLGCESEAFLARKLIAVNVPKDIDYSPIRKYLERGEENGLWTFEESCLCHQYQ